jgi:ABC-type uncharacterized transport system permease subunit
LNCFQLPSTLFQSIAVSFRVGMFNNGRRAQAFLATDAAS